MKVRALVLLVIAVLACSCSEPLEKRIVGTYKAKLDTSAMSGQNKAGADMMAAMINQTVLEIKPEGKASIGLGTTNTEATWTLEGTKLSVKPKTGAGMDLDASDPSELKVTIPAEQAKQMEGAKISFVREKK
jgi:hypothetical protein